MCPPAHPLSRASSLLAALVAPEPGGLVGWLETECLDETDARWLQAQGLASYAFHRLREGNLLTGLASPVHTMLQSAYYEAATQHTLLGAELLDLLDVLRPMGIEPVVLKGVALGITLYPSPAARPTSDLDLLIEESQVETVRQVLAARGYQDMGLDSAHHTVLRNHTHVWREYAMGQRISVEVHWQLVHHPGYARRMDANSFMSRTSQVDLQGRPVRVLHPIDQLLHACAHLLLHHALDWNLLWLLDLRLLVDRFGCVWDWGEIVSCAEEFNLAGALRYWLELAETWYGPFLPPQATRALARVHPVAEEKWFIGVAQNRRTHVWEYIWRRACGIANIRQWMAYVREWFFPPWAYMQYRYGARTRWLAPVYYAWRLVRAGWVAFRRVGPASAPGRMPRPG